MLRNRITGGLHRRWRGGRTALLILALLLPAACTGPESPTSPSSPATPSEVEFQLLQLANGARSAADVEPQLIVDAALGDIARNHSIAMRDLGFFGHQGPDGRSLRRRLEEAGIDFSRAAENLAQVTNSADPATFAHELLMDSERHRANILDPRFRYVGVGVARSQDTFWITEIFIQP